MWVVESITANSELFLTAFSLVTGTLALFAMARTRLLDKKWQRRLERILVELDSTNSNSMGMGKRVLELEKKIGTLLEEKEEQANGYSPYTLATEMLSGGADIDHVVNDCGISRAEAELMQLMHKQMKRCGPAKW